MKSLRFVPIVFLALTAPSAAHAQINQTALIQVVEVHKAAVLRYIDAAPDSMLGFRPTPGVRTYAQQIEHAAGGDAFIAHLAITGSGKVPSLGDTAQYLHNKAALREYATKAMDHAIGMLRGVTDAQMTEQVDMFGNKVPRWRALLELLDHFPWTLGQTVPYLRLNGVTPPEYTPF